jgi:hypothetical protein
METMRHRPFVFGCWLAVTYLLLSGGVSAQPPGLTEEQLISLRNSDLLQPPTPEEIRAAFTPLRDEKISTKLPEGFGLPPPQDASEGVFTETRSVTPVFRGEDFSYIDFHWAASNLRHRPLYFEDAMLERHGQAYCPLVQPAASGARFFLTFPVLPYVMTVNPPYPAQSTLGDFRPGSAVPLLCQRPPLQLDAGVVEAGVWIGLILLIP